jgi:hypothetical protein
MRWGFAMRMTKTLQCACGLLLAASPAFATPLPATGIFIYTSQCLAPDGLIAGYRVSLLRTKTATKAQIDFTDAGEELHDLAGNVRFDAKTGALSFYYKGKSAHAFAGSVTKEALTGSFDKAKPTSLMPVVLQKDIEWSLETLRPCGK